MEHRALIEIVSPYALCAMLYAYTEGDHHAIRHHWRECSRDQCD
jgi:hypothetical protein